MNRDEIEREFLALVLNKPELLDFIKIKSTFLSKKDYQNILKYSVECYSKLGYVDYNEIIENHNDLNLELMVELMCNTFYNNTKYQQQLKFDQQKILEFYKQDYINKLNEYYKENKIKYDEYMSKMNKINDYRLTEDSNTLSKQEILNNINVKKTRIRLNSYGKLNSILEFVKNDFIIVGATTGGGKSGFLLNLMSDLMNDYQCIYFNMEMSKPTIYKRLISINSNIPINLIDEQLENKSEDVTAAIEYIENSKIIVENLVNDLKSVKSIIAKNKDENRHTIVFLDHIGLMKSDKNKSLYEQSTDIAKQLRQICLNYDCTIIAASQMNRTAYSNDKLSLNQLKDSGEVENSASKIILLYPYNQAEKNELTTKMIVDVAKNRDGRTGVVIMQYDKIRQIFKEIDYGKRSG